MKLALVPVLIWTIVFAGVLVLYGDNPPCPEVGSVGLTDQARDAALKACFERARATGDILSRNEPWSWLAIWGLGAAALMLIFEARHLRRNTQPSA